MVTARVPTLVVGGKTLAPAQVILPLEITVGRENPTAQPNANAMSFSYLGALPPQFVRGAPVSATMLGYEEPGWSDIWDDLWSHEEPTPGLLPPPTPEGFPQWQRIWGWYDYTEVMEVAWNHITDPKLVNASGWSGVAAGGGVTGVNGLYSPNTQAPELTVWSAAIEVTAPPGVDLDGYLSARFTIDGAFGASPPGLTVVHVPAGTTARFTNTQTLPAGSNGVRLHLTLTNPPVDGSVMVSRPQLESVAEIGPYFDGDTPDVFPYIYSWLGAQNASESIKSQIIAPPTGVEGWYEDGGATLVTDLTNTTTPKEKVLWQGQSFPLTGATDRTVRTYVSIKCDPGERLWANWEVLWSPTHTNPDYGQPDVFAVASGRVQITEAGEYMSAELTVPDAAMYARLAIVIDPNPPATWDEAIGTWDAQTSTWDTYPN